MLCRIINVKTIITLFAFFSVINTFAYNICEVCENKQIPDGKKVCKSCERKQTAASQQLFMGMMNSFFGGGNQGSSSNDKSSRSTAKQENTMTYEKAAALSKARILKFLQSGKTIHFSSAAKQKLQVKKIVIAQNLKSVTWNKIFLKNNKIYCNVKLKNTSDNWLDKDYQFSLVREGSVMYIDNILAHTEGAATGFAINYATGNFDSMLVVVKE